MGHPLTETLEGQQRQLDALRSENADLRERLRKALVVLNANAGYMAVVLNDPANKSLLLATPEERHG